jgi:hypothetical protein
MFTKIRLTTRKKRERSNVANCCAQVLGTKKHLVPIGTRISRILIQLVYSSARLEAHPYILNYLKLLLVQCRPLKKLSLNSGRSHCDFNKGI